MTRVKRPTAANPKVSVGTRDWSYEGGDAIYFFVTMSEPVTVTGSPRLKLDVGSHFEKGAASAYATFLGGGYGESKSFWKNNERSPLKSPTEANNWYENTYKVHDGECGKGATPNDGVTSDCELYSPAGACDCAEYSGVSRNTADATMRLRRVHDFRRGDLIVVQGVTGPDASLLNKQHAVGRVSAADGPDADGHDQLTFEPPLDLRGKTFDASRALVGAASVGNACRAAGEKDATKHGPEYCLFTRDSRYHQASTDSTLLDHSRYGAQLPGRPNGARGLGNTGRGATFGTSAEEGGSVVPTRKRIAHDEGRTEQYMDNVLAFKYVVQGVSGNEGVALEANGTVTRLATQSHAYVSAASAPSSYHATPDLDYASRDALELRYPGEDAAIRRACGEPAVETNGGSRTTNCRVVNASLTLPHPRNAWKGTEGAVQSLSFNKDIVVGPAHVTRVHTDAVGGRTYGFNQGRGVYASAAVQNGQPDVVDVKVRFSEPVVASCGRDDDRWSAPAQYTVTMSYTVCESIFLVLATRDGSSVGDANHDTTTGVAGGETFPTAFLFETGGDDEYTLNFRYLVRRGDKTAALDTQDEFALRVECAAQVDGACVDRSSIRRRADNKLTGVRVPPRGHAQGLSAERIAIDADF